MLSVRAIVTEVSFTVSHLIGSERAENVVDPLAAAKSTPLQNYVERLWKTNTQNIQKLLLIDTP